MSLSMSDIILPTFVGGLTALKTVLEKGAAYADANKLDERALLDARLFPNMFTFTQQIHAATDGVRRGLDRIVGDEPSSVEDTETTFGELIARVESTIAHVKAADTTAMDDGQTREFTVELGQKLDFTGERFLLRFALPNFLFHVVTAYDILRETGVDVGKRDFIAPFMMA